MEIINEASEKFKDKQAEICEPLFELLRQINALEKEVCERSAELESKRIELGLPESQTPPGKKELWAEYRQRLGEIVKPAITEKLAKRGWGGSFGSPQKYGYIDGDCRVVFIMKTAKRAVVETHFSYGLDKMHKLVLRDVDGKWLLDEVYYGFEDQPDKWYADDIR